MAIDSNVIMQMLTKEFNVSKFKIYNVLRNNLNKRKIFFYLHLIR